MIHNNEIVSIEEVLIKSLPPQLPNTRQLTRKFIFTNRSTHLRLCVSGRSAAIDSCEINDHQIIVGNENEEAGSLSSIRESPWTPHVFGHERILSFEELPQRQLTYQLTKDDEFIIEGKGFNSILSASSSSLINPSFINLNSVDDKPSLEGHYLRIYGSHESINVFTESNSVFSQFISNVPLLIADYLEGSDFVCSANPSTTPNAAIVASLTFGGKTVDVSLEIEQWTASHLRVQIQNGSIAFIPHNMSRFLLRYKFTW